MPVGDIYPALTPDVYPTLYGDGAPVPWPTQLMAGVEQCYILRKPFITVNGSGKITAAQDLSGKGHHLAFSPNAPDYVAGGVGGHGCAELSSNEKLTVSGLPYVLGDSMDVYMVMQFNDTLPFATTEAFWSFDGQHKLVSVGTTANFQSDMNSVNNGYENLATSGGLTLNPLLVASTMYGGEHNVFVNGVKTAGGTSHGGIHTAEGSFTIGDLGSVTHTYRLAELVIVRNVGNDADRLAYQNQRVAKEYPSISLAA